MSTAPRILIVANDDVRWRGRFDRDDVLVVARTPLEAIWRLERDVFTSIVRSLRIGSLPGRYLLELVRDWSPATARVLMIAPHGSSRLAVEEALASGAVQAVLKEGCDPVALDTIVTLAESARAIRQMCNVARPREWRV